MVPEEGGGDLSARGRPGVGEFARIAEFGETVSGDGFEEFDLAWRKRLSEDADLGGGDRGFQGGVVSDGGGTRPGFGFWEAVAEGRDDRLRLAEKMEKVPAHGVGVLDHRFEANLKKLPGRDVGNGRADGADKVFPSAGGAQKAGGTNRDAAGGFGHVPAVADKVDDSGLGEKGQKVGKTERMMGCLVSPAALAVTFGIEGKKSGDQGGGGGTLGPPENVVWRHTRQFPIANAFIGKEVRKKTELTDGIGQIAIQR